MVVFSNRCAAGFAGSGIFCGVRGGFAIIVFGILCCRLPIGILELMIFLPPSGGYCEA